MDNQISTASPDNGGTANPATGTDAVVNGNGQPNGEANGQSATGSESFVPKNVDLNTLPPQVRAYVDEVNKQMVRGFSEKTTKISETVKSETAKAVEAYRQKADWYDTATKDEKLVSMINDYVQKLQTATDPTKASIPPELQQRLEKVDQIEMKLKTAETLEVINAFADAKDDKGNPIHPDFDKFSGLKIGTHAQAGEYDLLRASIELAPGNTPQEKMENGYKAAKATYDAIFEEGKKAGMGRLHVKAQNGSLAPSSVNTGSTASRQPKNALEALQFARQGLAVHRD